MAPKKINNSQKKKIPSKKAYLLKEIQPKKADRLSDQQARFGPNQMPCANNRKCRHLQRTRVGGKEIDSFLVARIHESNYQKFQKFGKKLPFVVLRVAATFYTPSVT